MLLRFLHFRYYKWPNVFALKNIHENFKMADLNKICRDFIHIHFKEHHSRNNNKITAHIVKYLLK